MTDITALYDDAYFANKHAFALRPSYRLEETMVLVCLRAQPGDRLLDVGCSSGVAADYIEKYSGARVVRLDRFPFGIRRMPDRHLAGLGDGHALPFQEGLFQGVWLMHVLAHLADPARAVREIRRVLAPGGRLVVITPNAWYSRLMWLANLINGYQPDPTVVRHLSRRRLEALLERAGYRIELLSTFGELPPYWPRRSHWWCRSRLLIVGSKR